MLLVLVVTTMILHVWEPVGSAGVMREGGSFLVGVEQF